MNGRIFRMDIPAHQAVQELLPWYATAQLAAAEAALVHEHLQGCAHCRQELEWERELRAQAAAADDALPPGVDMEAAMARLMPMLGKQDIAPAAVGNDYEASAGSGVHASSGDAVIPAASGTAAGSSSWWRRAANQPTWLRWGMAAQWALIAGLAFLLARPAPEPASYRVLGSASSQGANIVVVFHPDASEGELRRILQAQGARVVDGPTVTDAYLIAVPAAGRAQALQALQAERAVKLAVSLEGGSP